MKPACPRLFQAEAWRDGRLVGAEIASFERHLTVCHLCSREVQALQALGESLRRPRDGDADADELHVRRERTRLLAAFDAALVPPEQTGGARRWLFGMAAFAMLSAALLLSWRARRVATGAAATSAVIVHADSTASWSTRVEGSVEKVVLERGVLSIHVDHARSHRRLLVVLPDGELEDMGTTFTVSADAGRTTRVTVQDGSVVLRIHGQAAWALSAGDTWSPPIKPTTSACASCEPSPVQPIARERRAPPRSAPASSARSPSPIASALEPDPSIDFRAAMAALDLGENRAAAARFAGFVAKHAGDARAEDASYLRVIALQRAGDADRMKEAVFEYLRRYPTGFRHAEVEALSR
ncbi:MAG TPA: hypothetical protein VK550_29180 [Polyangiaceae bacterium]|nr:hypothetical protein [Polyangiaceae bacterium]